MLNVTWLGSFQAVFFSISHSHRKWQVTHQERRGPIYCPPLSACGYPSALEYSHKRLFLFVPFVAWLPVWYSEQRYSQSIETEGTMTNDTSTLL